MVSDSVKKKEYDAKRYEERKQNAHESISAGYILDQKKWNLWCKEIKKSAKRHKHPFSIDFTDDIMFEMMSKGCFYCGCLATTIDRIDSKRSHMPDNCVGCCHGCNISKGASDSATFVRKAYYRARGEYVDDDNEIWFVYNKKPSRCHYKIRAKRQGVPFELSNADFDVLIEGDCEYCKRSPDKWFGIDRKISSLGYVFGNVASCCFDCNVDKLEDDVDTMKERNERIAYRVHTGKLIIKECEKVVLHKGMCKTSKKVCAYGNVYSSKTKASRALGKYDKYVTNCITNGRYPDDIFEINDE